MNEPQALNNPGPEEYWVLVRVERSEIFFLRYTLEAYEGLCVSTTQAGGEGLVLVYTAASQRETLNELIEALGAEMELEVIERGEGIYGHR